MALKGCNLIPEEQELLTRIISNSRDALEWLAEMEELTEELHEHGNDVEVKTSRLSGSFVEVTIKAYFDTQNPPTKATHVMGDYTWNDSSINKDGNEWRLYLKRRYSIS